jgi:cyclase
MLKKRIIPCLDIKDGRTVKGIHFDHLKDAGDPIELAMRYEQEGADELVFLDITATNEKRKTLIQLVKKIAKHISIPFTVGGGVSAMEDASVLLAAGADKIAVNSAALARPTLITELSETFGKQCVVLAIDVKQINHEWKVFSNGGKIETIHTAQSWATTGTQLGAGEILLTSMNGDGTQSGFSLSIVKQISGAVDVPVIASGGAGEASHFFEVFNETEATGALAASVFHYGHLTINQLKTFLHNKNIPIRL